jgi:hypothetical protein
MLDSQFIVIPVNDTHDAPLTQVVQLSTACWIKAVIYHWHIFDARLRANASGAPQRQIAPVERFNGMDFKSEGVEAYTHRSRSNAGAISIYLRRTHGLSIYPPARPAKVLVVDDERVIADTLQHDPQPQRIRGHQRLWWAGRH